MRDELSEARCFRYYFLLHLNDSILVTMTMCLFMSADALISSAPLSSRMSGVRVGETSRLFLLEGVMLLLNCYATNPAVSSAWCSLPKQNEL